MHPLAWIPLAAGVAWSQESLPDSLTEPYSLHEPEVGPAAAGSLDTTNSGRVFFDLRAATPFDDFQIGGRAGFFAWTRIVTDFFLDFEMRPYRRAVRIRESETLEYQFREQRFTIGPGFLARVPLGRSPAVLVAGGGAGLSPAWYRGSNREAPSTALGWLETGFRFWSPPSAAEGGFSYQVFPLPGVSPHRIADHFGHRRDAT
jgi:hypothetical protein